MKIGDCVCSMVSDTMIGKIVKFLNNNLAMVMVNNREVLVDLRFWRKVVDKGGNKNVRHNI